MNYVLRCEKCDRPAPVVSTKHGRSLAGNETVKKIVPNKCACGGTIKPVMD